MAEVCFPRGRVEKPKTKQSKKPIYGAAVPLSAKDLLRKFKQKSKDTSDRNISQYSTENARLLNVHSLEVGMLILGCIRSIGKDYMLISLPGRVTGRVTANDISEAYSNARVGSMASPLHNLYNTGEFVCCRVMSKSVNTDNYFVNLSLNPKNINSHIRSHQICLGFALVGAIKVVEDHGYIIDTGISNSSAFMPLKNCKQKMVTVGEIIVGCVEKIVSAKEQPTFVLKQVQSKSLKSLQLTKPNMDGLMPGTVVDFTVTDYIEDGLKGHLFDGLFENVYININQLQQSCHKITSYQIGSTWPARILYVTNLSKLIHCTLNLEEPKTNEIVAELIGTVAKDAEVVQTTNRCVYFQWRNDDGEIFRGVMNVSTSSDEMSDKYPLKSKHEVEINDFYLLDHIYKCSPATGNLWKRVGSVNSMEIGNVVDGVIAMPLSMGGYGMKIGRVYGYMHEIDLKPSVFYKNNDSVTVKVIAIDYDKNTVQVTNRPEYFTPYAELLSTMDDAKCGRIFSGVIFKDSPALFIIRFANNMKAALSKESVLDGNLFKKLKVGRIFEFKILSVTKNGKIKVSVATDEEKRAALTAADKYGKLGSKSLFDKFIGTQMQGVVSKINEDSLSIEIPHLSLKGTINRLFLSNFNELCGIKLKLYEPTEKLDCVCVGPQLFSVRDLDFCQASPNKLFGQTHEGDIIKSSILKLSSKDLELYCPIQDVKVNLKTTLQNVLKIPKFEKDITDNDLMGLGLDQVICARIEAKRYDNKSLSVSANLFDVWTGSETATIDMCINYFKELEWIRQKSQTRTEPLAELSIGELVDAEVIAIINESTKIVLKVKFIDVDGVIEICTGADQQFIYNIGETIKCAIVFIDYSQKLVYLTSDKKICKHLRRQKKSAVDTIELDLDMVHDSKFLFKNNDIIVFYSKTIVTKLPFVFISTRFHYNDFYRRILRCFRSRMNDDNVEHKNHQIKIVKTTNGFNFGLFEEALQFCNHVQKKSSKIREELKEGIELNLNKRKFDEMNDVKSLKIKKSKIQENIEDNQLNNNVTSKNSSAKKSNEQKQKLPLLKPKKIKKNKTNKQLGTRTDLNLMGLQMDGAADLLEQKTKKKPNRHQKVNLSQLQLMPGVENFWCDITTTRINKRKADESSSNTEEDEKEDVNLKIVKQKHLTKKKRLEMVKTEEDRLYKIEQDLANNTTEPHNSDHFDRLLLGSPNNSLLWIKYMCHHMEAAEIDKARNVAHRAMKMINFREEDEVLNVWLALLNLEIRYGNEGTWNLVLEEALVRNNPFKIYSKAAEILLSVKKTNELHEILQKMLKKFKQIPDMWTNVATLYLELGLIEKVKQLLAKALVCLPVKDHIQMIVRFAFLNNKYGNKDQAHVLFDQVVTSYPKRVDIWSQYIDMLIKDNMIEAARQILDRAVSQKLQMKKMKTIFTKYVQFEEKYGDPKTVHSVKKLAAEYVKTIVNQPI